MSAQNDFSILLVDDDPMVIRVLSHMLSEFSPLRFATSGHVALKLARQSIPDLVLLDVEMPEFSGFEVCQVFKNEPALSVVPIVFITSHENPLLQAKGIELGGEDFIVKPPNAALLLSRIRTYQRMKALSDTLSTTLRSVITMDFLTGTATRRQLEKALTQEWLRAQRSAVAVALLVADIEDFTAYNAEWGEENGDACLKAVADALRSVVRRPADMVGRYAGGKFALLLPETDTHGAISVARRAIEAVDALRIPRAMSVGQDRQLTLSIGAGCRDSSPPATASVLARMGPSDLIAAAEIALTRAKSAGGHRVGFLDIANPDASKAVSFLHNAWTDD